MNLFKRLVAFTVSVTICAGAVLTQPVAEFVKENIYVQKVFAEIEEETANLADHLYCVSYTWNDRNNTVVINGVNKPTLGTGTTEWPAKVIIPSELVGCTVIELGFTAFDDSLCKKITSITLPDTLEKIGDYAFRDTNITTLHLPASLKTIGYACPKNGTLESFTVDEESPYYYAVDGVLFQKEDNRLYQYPPNKKDEEYTIPSGTKQISLGAFRAKDSTSDLNEKIKVLNVPAEVDSSLGSSLHNQYSTLSSLEAINVDPANPNIYSIDGVLFDKKENMLLSYPANKPDSKYTIPAGITKIGDYAFSNCNNLKEIDLGDVTEIGFYAFSNCKTIESISIPDSVTSIGDFAFFGCGVKKVKYTKGMDVVPKGVFQACNFLTEIVLPDNITEIRDYAFSSCGLENFEAPGNLVKINQYAFDGCSKLREIVLGEYLSRIEGWAFHDCDELEAVTIKNPNCNIIGNWEGQFSKVIPGGYTNAGTYRFSGVIYGYEDSTAEKWAKNNGIAFESLGEKYGYQLYYEDNEFFQDYSLNDTIDSDLVEINYNSFVYSPGLAFKLSFFSSSIYEETGDLLHNYLALGYSNIEIKNCYRWFETEEHTGDNVGYAFGEKLASDGKKEILITVRGTDLRTLTEWLSDAKIGYTASGRSDNHYHNGFYNAFRSIWEDLRSYTGGKLNDYRFIITGHSRGAAVANILEKELTDLGVKVFGYNFAVPDTVCLTDDDFPKKEYRNIFNISNCHDPISKLPGRLIENSRPILGVVTSITGYHWDKFGRSYWYSPSNWDTMDNLTVIDVDLRRIVDIVAKAIIFHPSENYVLFLSKKYDINSSYFVDRTTLEKKQDAKHNLIKFVLVSCPVDVIYKDENNNVLATVINEEVNYTDLGLENIYVLAIDDKKYCYMNDDTNVIIETTAYDTGSMTIISSSDSDHAVKYDVSLDNVGQKYELKTPEGSDNAVLYSEDGKIIECTDSYLRGDINKDKAVSGEDIVIMDNYLLCNHYDGSNILIGDMNDDETIDIFDMMRLKQRVLSN